MSQEIIEAVHEIERDKGIEEGALVAALEDALLAAYKKTPGASRHATVEMDDHIYMQRIREQVQGGRESGVRSTPTFFVDGRIQDVSFGLRFLFDAVDAALAK